MTPEEFQELAELTVKHEEMFDRIKGMGVAVNVVELLLERLECKLDVLLGDNAPRASLVYERRLDERWAGVEERLAAQIAELEAAQAAAEARARLGLGPDGSPPTL